MRERLTALKPYAKYWPVALFVLANMAAVALVIRAQTASDDSVATSAIRRPTDLAADPTGAKPPEALDLESARAAADVPMVLDWTKAPGAKTPSTQPTTSPGQSLLERLAMGLGVLRDDARAAYDRKTRLSREALVGIRSPLFTGTLPPIGNPLSPLWTPSFMPPFDPTAGTTGSLLRVVELDPDAMSPEYMATLIGELQRQGTLFKFKDSRGVAAVPSGVAAGMTRVRPVPSVGGLMAALPGPPADVAAPGAEPRLFTDGRPRLVMPSAPDTPAAGAPAVGAPRLTQGNEPAPSAVTPPTPAPSAEVATGQTFMSAIIATKDEADAVAGRLRSAGGSTTVSKSTSGPGYKVYCRITCRKSERREMAAKLSGKAGVTIRITR